MDLNPIAARCTEALAKYEARHNSDLPVSRQDDRETVKVKYSYLPWWKAAVRIDSGEAAGYFNQIYAGSSSWKVRLRRALTFMALKCAGHLLLPSLRVESKASRNTFDVIHIGRGQNKIRLISFDQKLILNITRNDSRKPFFLKEIENRRGINVIPAMPKLLEADPGGLYFTEEWIPGFPFWRLHSDDMPLAFEKVTGILWEFYEKRGYRMVSIQFYSDRLAQGIQMLSKKLDKNAQDSLLESVGKLKGWIAQLAEFSIRVVQSHGDFHPGNVIVSGEKIVLLDWENSAERSLYHDWFNWSVISSMSFERRMRRFEPNAPKELIFWLKKYPDFLTDLVGKDKVYRAIYFMERIHFELEADNVNSWWIGQWVNQIRLFWKKLV